MRDFSFLKDFSPHTHTHNPNYKFVHVQRPVNVFYRYIEKTKNIQQKTFVKKSRFNVSFWLQKKNNLKITFLKYISERSLFAETSSHSKLLDCFNPN